jgi:hypothetical protein
VVSFFRYVGLMVRSQTGVWNRVFRTEMPANLRFIIVSGERAVRVVVIVVIAIVI